MRNFDGITPVTAGHTDERTPGATLEEDELKKKLESGEIKLGELPSGFEERYRDFVRMHKLAKMNRDI
jgi:hypothetical protein